MEKTIRIDDDHALRVDNNLAWMMIYKSQFGHDIIPEIMPFLGAMSEMITGLAESGFHFESAEELMQRLDKNTMTNMLVELTGVELVSFLNICWAMAKSADDDIEEPIRWIRQFDTTFPLDKVAPELFSLIMQGVMSEKNWKRLQESMRSLKPKKTRKKTTKQTSSKSSPQESVTD